MILIKSNSFQLAEKEQKKGRTSFSVYNTGSESRGSTVNTSLQSVFNHKFKMLKKSC